MDASIIIIDQKLYFGVIVFSILRLQRVSIRGYKEDVYDST
jgi:hypothetical protein